MEIKFLNGNVFVPKNLGGGGNYPKDSRGVSNPNNPPFIYATGSDCSFKPIKCSNSFNNGQHSPIKGVKSFNSKVYALNIELSRS